MMKQKIVTLLFCTFFSAGSFAQYWAVNDSILWTNPVSTKVGIGTDTPADPLTIKLNYPFVSDYAFRIFSASSAFFSINRFGAVVINGGPPRLTMGRQRTGYTEYGMTLEHIPGTMGKNTFYFYPDLHIVSYNGGENKIAKFESNGDFRLNGNMYAKEVNVKTDVWSDFVFADDYQLKPLSEVENFIKINKHLPDVPSATQVTEKGINVAEMNAILLQKIEETMLYVIELKKENQELKRMIENFKKQTK